MTTYQKTPICMAEEFWANSQFSIARFYGQISFNGHTCWILDKFGHDLWECTRIANEEGREMAIEAGEPCDLVREDFIGVYKDLGRDKFLELLQLNRLHSDGQILKAMKAEARKIKRRKKS